MQKLIFAILLYSFTFCRERRSDLDAVAYISYIPIIGNKGVIYDFADTVMIYKYTDKMMYEFHSGYKTIDENGIETKGTVRKYFIHKQNDSLGNLYILEEENTLKNLSVDSLLMLHDFKNANWLIVAKHPPFQSHHDRSKGILKETYFIPPKSKNDFDSAYFYYSNNLHTTAYSHSLILDSLKKMKLFRIELIYNPFYDPNYSKTIPRRVASFEIKTGLQFNKQEVLEYLKKFENEAAILK